MGGEIGYTERYLHIDGLRTHVSEGGSGTPLLLVHGLGGPRVWQRVFEPLSNQFRVMAPDLPGFGESDPPSGSYASAEYAEFIFALTEMLDARRIVLCGTSWGGEVAVRFADRHPDLVSHLILICSTGMHHRSYAEGPLAAKILPALLKWPLFRSRYMIDYFSRRSYYRIENRPPGLCDQIIAGLRMPGRSAALSNALLNALRGDREFPGKLSRLRMPSLIIWGRNDAIVPVRDAPEFRRHIPGSTLELLSQCGHSIPLEKPRELVDAILKFTGKEPQCLKQR